MTADQNRFVNIQYCSGNNLPFSIMHPQGRIVNHYTLSGTKLGKMLFDRHGNLTYHEQYFGDLVISDGQPTRILHADGTINLNGSSVEYHYHLKDHLGNVRMVITPSANNKPQVLQATDYYPFGMSYTKNLQSGGGANQPNKYLYNSKEEQEMPGKWLDYGWRMYDAQLGRWHGVDPLAERAYSWTPYRYGFNNPIRFIDPDGRFETRKEAREHRRENKLSGRIKRQDDGTYAINHRGTGGRIITFNDSEFGITKADVVFGEKVRTLKYGDPVFGTGNHITKSKAERVGPGIDIGLLLGRGGAGRRQMTPGGAGIANLLWRILGISQEIQQSNTESTADTKTTETSNDDANSEKQHEFKRGHYYQYDAETGQNTGGVILRSREDSLRFIKKRPNKKLSYE
jgi:RHS repeat-associated protein